MAARLNPRHSAQVLERIKLAALVNLLQDDARGQLKNPKTGEPMELSQGRRDSAKFLIERKLARAVAQADIKLSGELNTTISWPLPKTPLDL